MRKLITANFHRFSKDRFSWCVLGIVVILSLGNVFNSVGSFETMAASGYAVSLDEYYFNQAPLIGAFLALLISMFLGTEFSEGTIRNKLCIGHKRDEIFFGYRKVPVIIRVMSDDEAVINMVDSNLQRQQITFSEKAFAYKMKNEAMKRTGGRRKSSQSDYPLKGKKTVEIIGEEFGDSAKQVQRYLKLADLIPELLEKLDNGELSFNPAVELSYLTIEEQKEFIDAMEYTQAVPSISQAQRMKKLSREKKLTGTKMREIMGEIKKGEITRVMFNNEQLYRYFPKSYTPAEMKEEILSMLNQWKPQKMAVK